LCFPDPEDALLSVINTSRTVDKAFYITFYHPAVNGNNEEMHFGVDRDEDGNEEVCFASLVIFLSLGSLVIFLSRIFLVCCFFWEGGGFNGLKREIYFGVDRGEDDQREGNLCL